MPRIQKPQIEIFLNQERVRNIEAVTINITEKILSLLVLLVVSITFVWFLSGAYLIEEPPGDGNGENGSTVEEWPVEAPGETPGENVPIEASKPEKIYAAYGEEVSVDKGQQVVFKDCTIDVLEVGENPSLEITLGDYSTTKYTLEEGSFQIDFFKVDITKASEEGIYLKIADASREVEAGLLRVEFVDPVKIKGTGLKFVVTNKGTGAGEDMLVLEDDEFHDKALSPGAELVVGEYLFNYTNKVLREGKLRYVFIVDREGF